MIKKLFEFKLIRYGVSASAGTFVDVAMYFIAFNYIFQKSDIHIFDFLVVSAPSAALGISYTCGLFTNFIITKYYVFTESDLRGHHQLMRYILIAILVLILNYGLMTFLIKGLNWYPTPSRAFSAITIGFVSFIFHKTFSFRVNKGE
ncbi:MAG: GtrA family protein [Bacteroidia bacterium]